MNKIKKIHDISQRRIVSIWLPNFVIDRHLIIFKKYAGSRFSNIESPYATIIKKKKLVRIGAVNSVAKEKGILPGMLLNDARASVKNLKVCSYPTNSNILTLSHLAKWCSFCTPWTAIDSYCSDQFQNIGFGLWLDITGCSHLFSNELNLLQLLVKRLNRVGFHVSAAVASTPGAAWAVARFSTTPYQSIIVVHPSQTQDALLNLPVAALRIPAAICLELEKLGLSTVDKLYNISRGSLETRFGKIIIRRIEQALGQTREPILSLIKSPKFRTVLTFVDPIVSISDVERAVEKLVPCLCNKMETAECGARKIELICYRVDCSLDRIYIETSTPSRDSNRLIQLFLDRVYSINIGFGIESIVLNVLTYQSFHYKQLSLHKKKLKPHNNFFSLVDRIANRLGSHYVTYNIALQSYIPERSSIYVSVLRKNKNISDKGLGRKIFVPRKNYNEWISHSLRPITLFVKPESIKVITYNNPGLPKLFRWRCINYYIINFDSIERIVGEWWRNSDINISCFNTVRDYYKVEDSSGRKFWIFCRRCIVSERESVTQPRWFLHGLFA